MARSRSAVQMRGLSMPCASSQARDTLKGWQCSKIGQLPYLGRIAAVASSKHSFSDALVGVDTVTEGIALTRDFLRDLYEPVRRGAARGASLKECFDAATAAMRPKYGSWPIFEHCQPFNVARAFDEAQGIDTPRIWTAERDRAMWAALQG